MSSDYLSVGRVKSGFWTDWQEGQVPGSKLTLSSSSATYLLAFLTIFVRLAGGHLWELLCYAVFSSRASNFVQHAFDQQQQAILRNNGSDLSAIWSFVQLLRAWPRSRIRRTWPLYSILILAFVHFVAISAAALFVTRVAEANSLALLEAGTCGTFGDPSQTTGTDLTYGGAYETWVTSYAQTQAKAFSYSVTCHTYDGNETQSISPNCVNMGIVPPTWSIIRNVTCPFSDHICSEPAVRLDSGLIDTRSDLGINTRSDDRLQYRTVVECAPLVLHGHKSQTTNFSQTGLAEEYVPTGFPEVLYVQYLYGPSSGVTEDGNNVTYTFNNDSTGYDTNADAEQAEWNVLAMTSYAENLQEFYPIPELKRTDADVTLLFLRVWGNELLARCNDPWFSYTQPYSFASQNEDGSNTTITYWYPEEPVRVLGCTQQYQLCNPGRGRCTDMLPLSSLTGEDAASENVGLGIEMNAKQINLLNRLKNVLGEAVLPFTFTGTPHLLISQQAAYVVQDDQWIRELDNAFSMMLTYLRLVLARYPQMDSSVARFVTPPTSAADWMCSAQTVRADGYTSFNTLGVELTLIFGIIVIATNLLLHKTLGLWGHGRLEWDEMSLLQIQSLALEDQGSEVWDRSGHVPYIPLELQSEEQSQDAPEESDMSTPELKPALVTRDSQASVTQNTGGAPQLQLDLH